MKYGLILLAVVIIGGGAYWYTNQTPAHHSEKSSTYVAPESAAAVTDGTYAVNAEASRVEWAGKKPLLEGYINTGSIAVTGGTVSVTGENVSAEFAIDMDTLSVSATPTKPGKESALEEHLKGERWFNVAAYPTASFAITNVVARADSATTFTYDVTGDLTLKGQTHPVTFPATIYLSEDGKLHAHGSLEIDRTVWGITTGSENFFDNLADNVIDDMVALSFVLIAEKQ